MIDMALVLTVVITVGFVLGIFYAIWRIFD